ncbi:MAG: PHB depolymerase family esterase [Sandaracinaceae bacterium]
MPTRRFASLVFALSLAACDSRSTADAGGSGTDAGGGGADAGVGALPNTLGPSERPAQLVSPPGYDSAQTYPVVVLLHGYSASGSAQNSYLGFDRATRAAGVFGIIPDGTVDASGNHFWNATPACCNFNGSTVDDVAYLRGLVEELETYAQISDVYFFGHSNGGFMSYRMACEWADRVSGIASLAGSDFFSETDCVPSQPVSVLQIHGDMDATIPYDGVALGYPSAPDVVLRWADRASCDTAAGTMGTPVDFETNLAGAETTPLDYETGCAGAEASLWTIEGGSHIPTVNREFTPAVIDWLIAHAR